MTAWLHPIAILARFSASAGGSTTAAEDELAPLDLRQIKVGGEIGRRIDVTLANHLLVIDVDKVFLSPLTPKKRTGDLSLTLTEFPDPGGQAIYASAT